MTTLKKAISYILSNEYLNYVISTGQWCHHGSEIFNFYDCEDLIMEYSNTYQRRSVMKAYIKEKLVDILDDLDCEKPDFLYRAIYANKEPMLNGFFGHYWSSREDTNICVEIDNERTEYLLCLAFDESLVNWVETLKSRLDYAYGEREQEYYLLEKEVFLENVSAL